MSSVNSLRELLVDQLSDILSAEKQLIKALPKMAEAATNEGLKAGFTRHLEETENHVVRLNEAFTALGEAAESKTCKAMKGLIEEGSEAIDLDGPDAVRDAALISAAQRVEHYEIAAYSTVRALAEKLREDAVAAILEETLYEESATDEKLTVLSEIVNDEADTSDDVSDDQDEEAEAEAVLAKKK